ncbi:hypothetical protein [Flavobacterium pedocola]
MKDLIIETLYKTIKKPYQIMFKKNKAWNLTIEDYMTNPRESLGYQLGTFLKANNFDIQQELEEHDVYHVLTRTGTTVKDEILMQFYLLGNGKHTPFVYIVIMTGIFFYPFDYKSFIENYKKGKQAHRFYDLDFSKMLALPIQNIQSSFNIK